MTHKGIGATVSTINKDIENKINEIGGKLEIIQSIMRAMNSALFGLNEFEERDGYSLASVLEEKINDLSNEHNEFVTKLKI